jgi:creatinine amidohydrolase/Fe(II)-dependent formamide hydrolase-like protein
MAKAENPTVTWPPAVQAILAKTSKADQGALLDALLFQPLRSGKHTSTREATNNGVVTAEDVKTSNAELGRLAVDYRVDGVVRFIEAWRAAVP